ncbi:hypothetical protein RvY_10384 [Ramazzottius varieornatus]|uniref:Uncharacterized protein n=1 Tax=Ramazzottius varieornatus TaxID=947166 RepID=A0A1D1VLL5_RAMVA|nr:hypothetical protein RvY_10384 [Ramazzottius varieornatus]
MDAVLGVGSPGPVTSGGKGAAPKSTRIHWDEGSQVRLLRPTVDFEGTDVEMWSDIFKKPKTAGMKLKTVRSAKDKSTEMINAFKASNHLDEWKSRDPGTFTEKEQLLVKLVNDLKEHDVKGRKKQSVKKALEDEK